MAVNGEYLRYCNLQCDAVPSVRVLRVVGSRGALHVAVEAVVEAFNRAPDLPLFFVSSGVGIAVRWRC